MLGKLQRFFQRPKFLQFLIFTVEVTAVAVTTFK